MQRESNLEGAVGAEETGRTLPLDFVLEELGGVLEALSCASGEIEDADCGFDHNTNEAAAETLRSENEEEEGSLRRRGKSGLAPE